MHETEYTHENWMDRQTGNGWIVVTTNNLDDYWQVYVFTNRDDFTAWDDDADDEGDHRIPTAHGATLIVGGIESMAEAEATAEGVRRGIDYTTQPTLFPI